MGRYELTDYEWKAIEPCLPNKPRGVPRVNDRRVLNGIFWVLRSGARWADLPERYGPPTTIYNRFNRWRKAGGDQGPPWVTSSRSSLCAFAVHCEEAVILLSATLVVLRERDAAPENETD